MFQFSKLETFGNIRGKKWEKVGNIFFRFSKVETCWETVQSCPKRHKFTVRNAKSRLKHQNMTLQKWKHHGKKMGKKWEKSGNKCFQSQICLVSILRCFQLFPIFFPFFSHFFPKWKHVSTFWMFPI